MGDWIFGQRMIARLKFLEEAQSLTGEKNLTTIYKKLDKYKGYFVVTDGPKGAYLKVDEKIHNAQSNRKKVINTTGAGDAFGSAFTSGIIKGLDWQTSLKLAILNSEGVIQKMGAKNGLLEKMPSELELEKVEIK